MYNCKIKNYFMYFKDAVCCIKSLKKLIITSKPLSNTKEKGEKIKITQRSR